MHSMQLKLPKLLQVQNRFWEMHDYLYEHQQALDDKYLEKYADNLGLKLANSTLICPHMATRVGFEKIF